MIDLSDCLVLGTLAKTHGIRGQLVLKLNHITFEDILLMETVFLEIEGLPVPFFVSEYTERSGDTIILTFDDIETESKAKELIGLTALIPAKSVRVTESFLPDTNDIIGFAIIDKKYGELGVLVEILDNDMNPLMKIVSPETELLVPLQQEFISRIDQKEKIITTQIPDGLLDL
jgi:16S rRNA processing protein RimM